MSVVIDCDLAPARCCFDHNVLNCGLSVVIADLIPGLQSLTVTTALTTTK